MSRRKDPSDHLDPARKPKIVHVIPPGAPGYREAAGGSMVVSTPAEVDGLVRRVGRGEVITLDDLRQALARRHGTAVACPVSTAIFVNMCARAAEDRRSRGEDPGKLTPWWRVLKRGGLLNPKLPGGVERQKALLAEDDVHASPLRRQLAVYDYEERKPSHPLEGKRLSRE
ncbi:MAG: MGMT family protein [Reyranella sp.]|jgi:hypothetical protein|nr:MGMT family protein [Reyranella sp.]